MPPAVPAELTGIETGPIVRRRIGDVYDLACRPLTECRRSLLDERAVAIPQADPRAGINEPFGNGEAQPLGTAGNDGHLAVKIDNVHLNLSRPEWFEEWSGPLWFDPVEG